MSTRTVEVSATAAELAGSVADRVVHTIRAQQQAGRPTRIALTAGSIMEQIWTALADSTVAQSMDWSDVQIYWGDERFVPADSPDRNDGPADRILFDHAPFDAAHQFPMPAEGGLWGDHLDAAATGYAATLAEHVLEGDVGEVPNFEIVLLGIGPDGHCCSLFPDHPSSADTSANVIAVRNSPKPPPERISLSFEGLNSARQIWVVASGSGKADAAAKALSGEYSRTQIPSAGADGREATIWFLDRDAAAELSV